MSRTKIKSFGDSVIGSEAKCEKQSPVLMTKSKIGFRAWSEGGDYVALAVTGKSSMKARNQASLTRAAPGLPRSRPPGSSQDPEEQNCSGLVLPSGGWHETLGDPDLQTCHLSPISL